MAGKSRKHCFIKCCCLTHLDDDLDLCLARDFLPDRCVPVPVPDRSVSCLLDRSSVRRLCSCCRRRLELCCCCDDVWCRDVCLWRLSDDRDFDLDLDVLCRFFVPLRDCLRSSSIVLVCLSVSVSGCLDVRLSLPCRSPVHDSSLIRSLSRPSVSLRRCLVSFLSRSTW